jgi:hypothetical protein
MLPSRTDPQVIFMKKHVFFFGGGGGGIYLVLELLWVADSRTPKT